MANNVLINFLRLNISFMAMVTFIYIYCVLWLMFECDLSAIVNVILSRIVVFLRQKYRNGWKQRRNFSKFSGNVTIWFLILAFIIPITLNFVTVKVMWRSTTVTIETPFISLYSTYRIILHLMSLCLENFVSLVLIYPRIIGVYYCSYNKTY